jgi:hypothetical protein
VRAGVGAGLASRDATLPKKQARPKNNETMIGGRIPKFFWHTMMLGIVGAVVVLSLFYGQYIWLTKQMTSASNGEHAQLLEESFERRARADLQAIADGLPPGPDAADAAVLSRTLDRAMGEYPGLTGLRLSLYPDLIVSSGNYPRAGDAAAATWLDEELLLSYPVVRNETEVGRLSGSFDLRPLRAELAGFTRELEASLAGAARAYAAHKRAQECGRTTPRLRFWRAAARHAG